MRRRDTVSPLFPTGPLREFVEADWPPAPGEVMDGCACGYCVARFGSGHESGGYVDIEPEYAAVWRTRDAFRRFRAARLAFLGEDHPQYRNEWLDLIQEEYQRQREAFEPLWRRDASRSIVWPC